MKNIAFVLPQFGNNLFGGGEIFAKLIAYHNKNKYRLTIITTKSKDHMTWSNSINANSEIQNGLKILRFPVDRPRNVSYFNKLTYDLLQSYDNSKESELDWIKNYGPYSSDLLKYLSENRNNYDVFIFFGYNHSLTYFGLPIVKKRAVLIPFVHQEPTLQFQIYDKVFSSPKVIAPSTTAEIDIIKKRFSDLPQIHQLGVGIDPPDNINGTKLFNIRPPYILYIGRIEKNKGVFELSEYFNKYKERFKNQLDLVFVGKQYDLIPKNKYFHFLGEIADQDKYTLIKNSELLVNPSFYESLSLTILEAWQQNKPILVNGMSEVLRSQVLEANGGLYYETEDDFVYMLDWLLKHQKERAVLGKQGNSYLNKNYSWPIINSKFEAIMNIFKG